MKTPHKINLYKITKAVLAIILLFTFSRCSYEPDINDSPVNIRFSADTIQFDTLFTGRLSVTKRLKIYNPSKDAIKLDEIELVNSSPSFQLIVNGVTGKRFSDELLLGKDSLLVLIEANIDQSDANNPFVIRENLAISNKGNSQAVILEAWGQNANYFNDSIISCNSVWTSEKPYVITNSILVEEGCNLTIEAGTKVYSGKDSFILVNGTLNVNGLKDSLVVFTNDRLDEPFSSSPGQWGGIILLEGSSNNRVDYADIKNSVVGFNITSYQADNQIDLFLNNTKVGNMTSSAILSLNSDFSAVNSLFYNTATSSCTHIGGGTANYLHCTIGNYFTSPRDSPALYLSDYAVDNAENEIIAPLNSTLINTIVYGRLDEEFQAYEAIQGNFRFTFTNCLFKAQQEGLQSNGSLINQDPLFINPFENNFQLKEGSPAISKALNLNVNNDLMGNIRDALPDIGAYEFSKEKEE